MDNSVNTKPTIEELLQPSTLSSNADYIAWKKNKIKNTLRLKKDGALTYVALDEIAVKFGFHER